MARVDIEVNGRPYQLNCEEGQEQRLRDLAAYLDGRIRQVTGGVRSGTEAQMLVVTALVLADELQDAKAGRGASALTAPAFPDEVEMVAMVERIVGRIEDVAVRLERA